MKIFQNVTANNFYLLTLEPNEYGATTPKYRYDIISSAKYNNVEKCMLSDLEFDSLLALSIRNR